MSETLADKLDAHAIRYANDYGYNVATNLKEAAAELRELEQLREWKSAILEKCKHSDAFDSLEWGGDKEGWGFVHYFIGHLNTRALHAETILAEQPASPLRGREAYNADQLYDALKQIVDWVEEDTTEAKQFVLTEARAALKGFKIVAQPTYEDIRWQRVNDEPFEYAIQQGPHGDEFVKLIGNRCLRRTLASRCAQTSRA